MLCEFIAYAVISVDNKNTFGHFFHFPDPIRQMIPIRVSADAWQINDLRANLDRLSEKLYFLCSVQ